MGLPPARGSLSGVRMSFRSFWVVCARWVCARAGIGHRAMKDLRDTYASQLLTSGVSLG
jgi:hypothetical protein